MLVNPCLICGAETPEGRQVCMACEKRILNRRQYKFTIYGSPATKKNSNQIAYNPQTKRAFITSSKRYKEWFRECSKQIKLNGLAPKEPYSVPVRLTYTFWMPTRRLCDDLNLSEAMDDILVENHFLADDNRDCVESHDGTRVFWDKENPRVEITITEMPEWKRWKDA